MRNKWDKNEEDILKKYYPITNDKDIINYFNDRSLTSIKVKAKRLKIYHNDEIQKNNRSIANSGKKNAMYGKTSKIKNKSYIEVYGKEKADNIKEKLSNSRIGKLGLAGDKNGMYGKISKTKGMSIIEIYGKEKAYIIKERFKVGIRNYWNSLNESDLNNRKNKLREEWLVKRNKYSEIDTIPEKITEDLLLKLNINYNKKENIGYYNCDFVVGNLIIEVQGDYWHANPKFYKSFDKIQQKNITRDKRKLSFLSSKNFSVLYLWEYDLKNNINICEEQIKNAIYE
jgi:G:T-mismatch repair DNA endonuclease (very short patch repair protein)